MAVNESRSMNGDLREGITDGSVKKVAPDRGGSQMDTDSVRNRNMNLHRDLYDTRAYDLASEEVHGRLTRLKG